MTPAPTPAYWLVKSEPSVYSYSQLQKDKRTVWDGVRNYEARNNLRAMRRGDLLLFYHSNEDKAVVGIAKVAKQAYDDPTDETATWSVVDVSPVAALKQPVTLDQIREAPALAAITMLKKNRLSVTPLLLEEFIEILRLGKTKPPAATKT